MHLRFVYAARPGYILVWRDGAWCHGFTIPELMEWLHQKLS